MPDGRGKLTYTGAYNGDIYEGTFKKGEPDGEGTYYHKNGNMYKGEFLNDKAHGKGIFYFRDGSSYEGKGI